MKRNAKPGYWVGVDWGESSHAVTVVDTARHVQKSFEVRHNVEGMEALSAALGGFQPVLGIAIESTRNLIIQHLLGDGYLIYPVNPKQAAVWREGDSVAGCKSDVRDGRVLAREIAIRWEQIEPLRPEAEEVRELALLCEYEQRLIAEQTRHVQRLESALRPYFPAALEFFTDWASPTAWSWLKTFPTAEAFARASSERLFQFLREHRIGISPKWRERVEAHAGASKWKVSKATVTVHKLAALGEVAQLQTIHGELVKCRKHIEGLFAEREDRDIFESLPGAGRKLAPRLHVMFGTNRDRYKTAEPIRLLSGVAPVMKQSGNRCKVIIRRTCKKSWRNTVHLFAKCSKKYCAWAKAFYDYRRAKGDGNAQALRKLADKWLKIIHRMWHDRVPYKEQQYMEQLYKTKSPLLAYLPVDKSVENH